MHTLYKVETSITDIDRLVACAKPHQSVFLCNGGKND